MKRKVPYKRKSKICSQCKKPRILWSGGLCKYCAGVLASKAPKKAVPSGKKSAKAGAKKGDICDIRITDRDLDQVFSWLVRTLYPNKCHACGKAVPYAKLECCHMVDRDEKSVRWDLRNCFPGCFTCNHDDQFHVVGLAKSCDAYYGAGMADKIHATAKQTYKTAWPLDMRRDLYNILVEALDEAEKKGADKDAIRIRVIDQTRRVL